MIWLETGLNGLMLGGLYALFGLGFSLIFGVMRIANIAHGEFVICGAFAAFAIGSVAPLPLWVVVPMVMALSFAAGVVVQTWVVNRVLSGDPMRPLLLTFGLSVILQNFLVATFGADNRGLDAGWLATADFQLGGVQVGVLPLCSLILTLVLFAGLHGLVRGTRFGRILRATSDDPEIVATMGIDPARVFSIVMGFSAALASLAGMLLAMRTSVTPFSGGERLLIAFEVVVIGGLGSIWASLIGGLTLGLVHAVGLRLDPASGMLYGHVLLLLILFARPEGLAGRPRLR